MFRLAIFVSGSGTNAENIIRFFASNPHFQTPLLISNKEGVFALERANRLGVPAFVLPKAKINDPDVVLPLLEKYQINGIILAGFLLKLPDFLISHFDRRVLNIHPALLPKYGGKGMYGHFVHEAVVQNRDNESGITIHLVNSEYDRGAHLFQAQCPVLPSDSPDDVAARVMELEQMHFPIVIQRYFESL